MSNAGVLTSPPRGNRTTPRVSPPDPTCINLKERFGDRFKVEYEESYYADRGDGARVEDPWLMIIPCQHGDICPWGGENLGACTSKAGSVAKRLKALPFATVVQDGDDGANIVFPVSQFETVAEIMRPRRRRRLSPEARRLARERLAEYQFRPAVGSPETALESTIGPSGD